MFWNQKDFLLEKRKLEQAEDDQVEEEEEEEVEVRAGSWPPPW